MTETKFQLGAVFTRHTVGSLSLPHNFYRTLIEGEYTYGEHTSARAARIMQAVKARMGTPYGGQPTVGASDVG